MKKTLALLLALLTMLSLTTSALAANFTPSAESKHIELGKMIGEDGKEHEGILYDKNGKEAKYVNTDELELIITNPDERNDRIPGITQLVNEGESALKNAKDLGELSPALKVELEKRKRESSDPIYQTIETEDLAVSAIFDISLVLNGEVIDQIPEGQTIKFRVQTDFRPGDVFFILVNCDGKGWVMVDGWEIDENGIVTITASQLCVMAFLVPDMSGQPKEDEPGEPGEPGVPGGNSGKAPKSPQTGYADWTWLLLAAAAAAGCGAVITLRGRKKSGAD